MKSTWSYLSSVFCGALVLGCGGEDAGNGTQGATTSTTNGNGSGSVTSAPGSVTDETAGDNGPTMATATSGSFGVDIPGEPTTCDNFAQDCPEGQKCAAYADDGGNAWNALKCVEVTGTDEPGDACTREDIATGIDTCVEGAMCWDTNAEGVGICLALCTGSAEAAVCELPGSPCTIANVGVLNLCLGNCNPLVDCPVPSDLCIPYEGNFICVLQAGEKGQIGDPCEFINVCDAGLVCLDPATVSASCDPAAGGCCTPFCPFPDGACPNPDQVCVQWFDPMMLPENDPQLDIGFCGLPG